MVQDSRSASYPGAAIASSYDFGSIDFFSRCTSTSGDYIRWESSSEGSNRRCKSLAAKALSAAANSIEISITIPIRFAL